MSVAVEENEKPSFKPFVEALREALKATYRKVERSHLLDLPEGVTIRLLPSRWNDTVSIDLVLETKTVWTTTFGTDRLNLLNSANPKLKPTTLAKRIREQIVEVQGMVEEAKAQTAYGASIEALFLDLKAKGADVEFPTHHKPGQIGPDIEFEIAGARVVGGKGGGVNLRLKTLSPDLARAVIDLIHNAK